MFTLLQTKFIVIVIIIIRLLFVYVTDFADLNLSHGILRNS